MPQNLSLTTLLVHDYDEAANYFTKCLGFEKREDTDLGGGKRWLVVAPPGGAGGLLLAKAVTPEQKAVVGAQSGGRVMFFLNTDNFARDREVMTASGVTFAEEPRDEVYGIVAVFTDLYGNKWDLIEPKTR